MGYPDQSNQNDFLVPNIPFATTTSGVLREIDIGAASASHGELLCVRPCVVRKLQFTLAGEAAGGSTTAPTVVFKKRPTPNSATGQTTVGTLTIPHGTAVGVTVYKDLTTATALAVGDSLEISWTIGVGSPTGMGFASLVLDSNPEEPENNSDMLASA